MRLIMLCVAEGKFKSKALMVPEHCIFDHIYGSSDCKTEPVWKVEGRRSCRNRDSDMNLASFAILAPCPNMVSVFRGVEFVCCPKSSEEGEALMLLLCGFMYIDIYFTLFSYTL